MTEQILPFTHTYDLSDLSQAGADVHLALKDDARARVAEWAGVGAVDSFNADIALKKLAPNRYEVDAKWTADIVQSCVVTLEPVKAHLSGEVIREVNVIRRTRYAPPPEEMTSSDSEDDGREDVDNPHYDLAVPVLEDFALAIDPYPRKTGVEFESPADSAEKAESPFAALKALKNRP